MTAPREPAAAGRPPERRQGAAAPGAGGSTAGAAKPSAGSPVAAPSVTLPKGGGAIRGMGETFTANPVTGTGSVRLPLPLTPGRPGLQPDLALTYDSAAGNGPFGLGWGLGLPAITRRTDRGIPRYADRPAGAAPDPDADVFLLAGAEDLVPAFRLTATGEVERDGRGRPVPDVDHRDGWEIVRYRPRTEGLFSRIERWTREADRADVHWRTLSRDNVTSLFGRDENSRIVRDGRIFGWSISASRDDRGNAVEYEYKAEDAAGIDFTLPHERHRRDAPCTTQRYPKAVRYGNVTSGLDPDRPAVERWLFEVVFDYGEGHLAPVPPDPALREDEQHVLVDAAAASGGVWPVRPDPFSTYRSAFEVRTYRRCTRVLMFHRIPELGAEPYLVRGVELDYADLDPAGVTAQAELAHEGSTRYGSFLVAATTHGYERTGPEAVTPGPAGERYVRYRRASLPPLSLRYSRVELGTQVSTLEPADGPNLPEGLSGPYHWADLDADGISGVLSEQGGAWWYARNRGGGRLGALERVAAQPAGGAAGRRFLDLAGDGSLDLVELDGATPGFWERTADEGWAPHRSFTSLPVLDWDDPNLRFTDLDGDGHADVLVTGDDELTWYRSLAEAGFGPGERLGTSFDEATGPRLVLADETHSVHLADMSGDGLADLVRIRSGEIVYWPNLGRGRFGARVRMANPPVFEDPDPTWHRRIRLADVDGSGLTDLVELGRRGTTVYLNQCGNGWSDGLPLPGLPPVDDLATVSTVDLLGTGTTCLVWSSGLPGDSRAPLRYVDLLPRGKPHLLVEMHNHFGAETHLGYAPSTRFSLAARERGEPWRTRLPFPVHVVERVETVDRVSGKRFVHRYDYYDGHYDGLDREFRGFSRVDLYDTELSEGSSAGSPAVLTRTWYHVGIPGSAGPGRPAPPLPAGLTAEEEREAYRALRGGMLRQETYALDGRGVDTAHPFGLPYLVAEAAQDVRLIQPRADQAHAVFLAHPRESVEQHHERDPDEPPRITHELTLAVDAFGRPTRTATLGYGRPADNGADDDLDPTLAADLRRVLATVTDTTFTNGLVDPRTDPVDHRLPLPSRVSTHELVGITVPAGRSVLTFAEVAALAQPGGADRRLLSDERIRYRRDDLTGPCDWDEIESRALPFDAFRLAFTPELLARTFRRAGSPLLPDPAAVLAVDPAGTGADRGGYVDLDADGSWWVPEGQVFYSPAGSAAEELAHARRHFFRPHRFRSPWHTAAAPTETSVGYDPHDLLLVETRDPLDNRITAVPDYRVVAPAVRTDQNGCRSAVATDALGMVVASAVAGPAGPDAPGDDVDGLAALDTLPTEAARRRAFADPFADPDALLGGATQRFVYDLHAFRRTAGDAEPTPAAVYALVRETHEADLVGTSRPVVQHTFSYSDGFGREVQRKVQAEPGPVPVRDAAGRIVVEDGRPRLIDTAAAHRWIGTGWTEFDDKARPTRRFEPFFSDTHSFDREVRIGVSEVLVRDPLGRVVAVLHPDHTYEKTLIGPWRQRMYDRNDTVVAAGGQTGDPRTDPDVAALVARHFAEEEDPGWRTWAELAADRGPDAADALAKAAAHADTPTTEYVDQLGRVVLVRAHNGVGADGLPVHLDSRDVLDIRGARLGVIDARGRLVAADGYDLAGRLVRERSMDAGGQWTLPDAGGHALRTWDSRGHAFRTEFDPLRRPVRWFVTGAGPQADPDTTAGPLLYQLVEYGEGVPGAAALGLRGRVRSRADAAGRRTFGYDFKGNIVEERTEVTAEYAAAVDWSAAPQIGDRFVARTRYDAVNRPIQVVTPHTEAGDRGVLQPRYSEANLLAGVDVWTGRAADPADLLDPAAEAPDAGVGEVTHDAHGRRTRIAYRNGVVSTYAYDPDTFRLVALYTRRDARFTEDCGGEPPPPRRAAPAVPPPGTPCGLQNLHYTYDPMGNLTRARDDAQPTVFFRNQVVTPSTDHTYDPTYRLVRSLGREHLGQAGGDGLPHSYRDADRMLAAQPSDGGAMGSYCESYDYDAVGNMLAMTHRRSCPGAVSWARAFEYAEDSVLGGDDRGELEDLVQLVQPGNRLTASTAAGIAETYSTAGDGYDAHGNMLRMPQLQELAWNFADRLRRTRRQAIDAADVEGTARTGERTFSVYDSEGRRVRKVTESATGALKEERLYVGGIEVYRRHTGTHAGLVRETVHVLDDDEQRIALVETRNGVDDGTPERLVRYQHADLLGSACLEVDEAALVVAHEEFSPYGSTTYQAVRSQVEVAAKRYRYIGRERDEESGLCHHGARYYAPWLARWTACDPAGLVDGDNLYCYAQCRPTVLIDTTGHNAQAAYEFGRQLALAGGGTTAALVLDDATIIGVIDDVLIPVTIAVAVVGVVVMGGALLFAGPGADTPTAPKPAPAPAPDAKPSPKPEAKPAPQPEAKPQNKPDSKPDSKPKTDPKPKSEPKPKPKTDPKPKGEPRRPPVPGDRKVPRLARVYLTYTARHKDSKLVYSGRTDGVIDLNKPLASEIARVLANRYTNDDDEVDPQGWGPAKLDTWGIGKAVNRDNRYSDQAYLAMRGREQQNIDHFGGAWSDTGKPHKTGNEVRGVAKDNPYGRRFHAAANAAFGQRHEYTGY